MATDQVKKYFEDSIEEGNGFYNTQSTKVSQNTRTLVMGIITTIWVVSYNDGSFMLSNNWMIASLFIGFAYLAIDILHYFIDTCFYYNKLLSLEKKYGDKKYLTTYNQSLIKHSRLSYIWIWIKFLSFVIIAFTFLIGILKHFF